MSTIFLAPFDPQESAKQRTRKTTLIRAHAARVSHEVRRQDKTSKLPRGYTNATILGAEYNNDEECHTNCGPRSMKEVLNMHIPAFIGSPRSDPFQCYPCILRDQEHILVDYSINILPYRFYGITKSGVLNLAVNFFRDVVFPLTLQEPVSFRCFVLAISAVHRADMAKVSFSLEMEHQKLLSLQMLRAHFRRQPDDCSDAAISMCLFRAVLEMTPGHEEHRACFIHLQHVARLISLRGGPDALRNNPKLATAINVYHYVSHDVCYSDAPISFDSHLYWETGLHPSIVEPSGFETQVLCENFIQFVRDVTTLSVKQETLALSRSAPSEYFASGKASFLSSWKWSSFSDWESTRTSFVYFRNQQIYGMCLLMHLNAALWDFQADPARLKMYLTEFRRSMENLSNNRNYSVEAAAHAVLLPPSSLALARSHFDRLWKVGKMLNIAKRLDGECWQRLSKILMSNLTFQHRPFDASWEEDFERVALRIPSSSWLLSGKAQYES